MKKVIIICDNCGKEIEEAEEADRMIEVKEPMCFPGGDSMRTSEKFPEKKHHKGGQGWYSREERKSYNKPYRQKIKQMLKIYNNFLPVE